MSKIAPAWSKIHALAEIWEISVNIPRRAGNSHIALILAAMSG